MDGIKIEVTGNIARVIEKPLRITSGTVGLPVEFAFDGAWDNLNKIMVFRAGNVIKSVDNPTVVPWEVLVKPNVWLSIGVYGTNADGSIAIPTTWANVCVIHVGVDPEGDPAADPTLPIWQKLMDYILALSVGASPKISTVELPASAWVGAASPYSQVVKISGVTANSQVDLMPSVEQLEIFHDKDLAFVTENEGGVVTVYALGDKPLNDYTMQVTITEVYV